MFIFTRSLFKIYGLFLLVLHFSVNTRPKIKNNKHKIKKTKQKDQILLEVSFFFTAYLFSCVHLELSVNGVTWHSACPCYRIMSEESESYRRTLRASTIS